MGQSTTNTRISLHVRLCSRELLVTRPAIPSPRISHHRRPVRHTLQPPDPLHIIRTVRDARFTHGLTCVHCQSEAIIRWGAFGGRQRYRCKSCRRTFSDLTRTAFAYTKKIGQWPHYLVLMRQGQTLRKCAQHLGLHVSTAFRWRHAVLTPMRIADPAVLSGTVELKEILFAHSNKGMRGLYEPRKRGARNAGWRWQHVPRDRVLLAMSRSGGSHASAIGGDVVVIPAMIAWTRTRLSGRCTAYGRMPRAGPCASPVRAEGHDYQVVETGGARPTGSRHTRNVDAFGRRLLSWLGRFRGVASRYRANYLIWHRHTDSDHDLLWASRMVVACVPLAHPGLRRPEAIAPRPP